MKKTLTLTLLLALLLAACTEEIDMSDRYVFRESTITGYLSEHEDYSEYTNLLNQVLVSPMSQSTVGQLLSARGHFTCFAPTNEAIYAYLAEQVQKGLACSPSWNSFNDEHVLDSIRTVIVKNSIIDGGDYTTYQSGSFPDKNSELELANMKDRKLSIHYSGGGDTIYVNESRIDAKNYDIVCSNGVIHQVHSVVAPLDNSMADILEECINGMRSDYRVMAMLVKTCGLMDTLCKKRDEAYEMAYLRDEISNYPNNGLASTEDGTCYVPQHRKYGFTLFAEPDRFWEQTLGKPAYSITASDVMQWVEGQNFYPEGLSNENYTRQDNLLNLFVTYHLLPMRIPNNKLVMHNNEFGFRPGMGIAYTLPVMEHYTTMGKPRLLKIYQSAETARQIRNDQATGIFLNRFPVLDNDRRGTGHELSCTAEKAGNLIYDNADNLSEYNTANGMIYPIDGVLAYSPQVRTWLMGTRLRFDVMSFFPEVMTNDIRQNSTGSPETQNVAFPPDKVYKYLANVSINDDTRTFCYFCAWKKNWNNLYGDELKGIGQYDYTFKLPPVPLRGTYEIRYKVLANSDRGVCQIYFGTNPDQLPIAGIPMDLTIGGRSRYLSNGTEPSIVGWEEDMGDEEYDAENDKKMRLAGFMKGPQSYWDGSITSRQQDWNIRRIIVRQTMDPNEQYYLRFKSCIQSPHKEFYMDYIEYCPKEIYDNPNMPEDIW